jgi:hypothetical protein
VNTDAGGGKEFSTALLGDRDSHSFFGGSPKFFSAGDTKAIVEMISRAMDII